MTDPDPCSSTILESNKIAGRNRHGVVFKSSVNYPALDCPLYVEEEDFDGDGYLRCRGRVCAVGVFIGGWSFKRYVYDADGRRVAKGSATGMSCGAPTVANGFTTSRQYLLDLGGEQVTELDGTGTTLEHSNAYVGGKLLATYDFMNGGMHFVLTDPLGTKRVQISGNGQPEINSLSLLLVTTSAIHERSIACPRRVRSPWPPMPQSSTSPAKNVTPNQGNDYFGARYYEWSMGRFMSPDWSFQEEPVRYAKLDDPQTLNLYGYVGNNPLSRADKDGHEFPDCGCPSYTDQQVIQQSRQTQMELLEALMVRQA